jgi:hypothetical protein
MFHNLDVEQVPQRPEDRAALSRQSRCKHERRDASVAVRLSSTDGRTECEEPLREDADQFL